MSDVLDHTDGSFTPAPPPQEVPSMVDYFACDETYKVMLPDGVQYFECKTLTEGDRKRYQSKTNRDLTIKKSTGDATMRLSTGEERHALIEAATMGWHIFRSGEPVTFSKGSPGSELSKFLDKVPPTVVDHIYKQISEKETWITGDISIADIDEQIEQLQQLRETKVKEQAGNEI